MRALRKVDASSWGIQEHFQLCMVAKHALQVDQLNAADLMSVDVIFRRLQIIEFAYAENSGL